MGLGLTMKQAEFAFRLTLPGKDGHYYRQNWRADQRSVRLLYVKQKETVANACSKAISAITEACHLEVMTLTTCIKRLLAYNNSRHYREMGLVLHLVGSPCWASIILKWPNGMMSKPPA